MTAALPRSLAGATGLDGGAGAAAVVEALAGQRARLLRAWRELSDDEWRAPSRCHAWTVHEVARHVVDASQLMNAQLRGEPSVFVPDERFDPNVEPQRWLEQSRHETPEMTLARFDRARVHEHDAATERVRRASDEQEIGPYGPMHWSSLAVHLLWDAWLHDRDIMLALGRPTNVSELEQRCVACYGLLIAAVPGSMAGKPVETTVALAGTGGGTFRLEGGPVVSLIDDEPAAVRGELDDALDAFSGRGAEVADVVHGDAVAIERLSWFRAFIRPSDAA